MVVVAVLNVLTWQIRWWHLDAHPPNFLKIY